MKNAVLITPAAGGVAQLGSTVTVEVAGKSRTYVILGSAETDPARGVISYRSPIGAALMGKKVGEVVRLSTKGKPIGYKVVALV